MNIPLKLPFSNRAFSEITRPQLRIGGAAAVPISRYEVWVGLALFEHGISLILVLHVVIDGMHWLAAGGKQEAA
ncbi:hypothetical protein AF72_04495 [Xylella taiwanensis]|uniref:Uncharacterized protein n=1 Tax=Xylella taiwanensis TaxID=1444770 RepID=Z9JLI6_9GAMM|nr:hypothetical protein AB672_01820 [Xylella taiwanensis]EWS78617.1 hypothetical protein AF72_04495 [Xylella taiwanensis]